MSMVTGYQWSCRAVPCVSHSLICCVLSFVVSFPTPASFLSSLCVALCQTCCSTKMEKNNINININICLHGGFWPRNQTNEFVRKARSSLTSFCCSICNSRWHVTFDWPLSLGGRTHSRECGMVNGKWKMAFCTTEDRAKNHELAMRRTRTKHKMAFTWANFTCALTGMQWLKAKKWIALSIIVCDRHIPVVAYIFCVLYLPSSKCRSTNLSTLIWRHSVKSKTDDNNQKYSSISHTQTHTQLETARLLNTSICICVTLPVI